MMYVKRLIRQMFRHRMPPNWVILSKILADLVYPETAMIVREHRQIEALTHNPKKVMKKILKIWKNNESTQLTLFYRGRPNQTYMIISFVKGIIEGVIEVYGPQGKLVRKSIVESGLLKQTIVMDEEL